MKRSLLGICAGLLAGLAIADPPATRPVAPATAPATAPAAAQGAIRINRLGPNAALLLNNGNANMLDLQRQNIRNQQRAFEAMTLSATFKPRELVKFAIVDGWLRAETALGALQRGQSRVNVEGSPATWLVNVQNVGLPNSSFVSVTRYDFDQTGDDEIWTASLNMNDNYFMLIGSGVRIHLQYQQANNAVSFSAMELKNGRYQSIVQLRSTNLLRLHAEHPDEVRQYLLPLLRRFTSDDVLRPGAADVYSVFSELLPSSTAAREVNELLPRLDSELFSERDAASRKLTELGAAGVLAAMRVDRAPLTEEQKGRLDAFIAGERRRSLDDVQAARRDPNFLLDCLEADDPAVRAAAKRELEKIVGHAVEFDIAADIAARSAAADELRKSLQNELQAKAATRPASGVR